MYKLMQYAELSDVLPILQEWRKVRRLWNAEFIVVIETLDSIRRMKRKKMKNQAIL